MLRVRHRCQQPHQQEEAQYASIPSLGEDDVNISVFSCRKPSPSTVDCRDRQNESQNFLPEIDSNISTDTIRTEIEMNTRKNDFNNRGVNKDEDKKGVDRACVTDTTANRKVATRATNSLTRTIKMNEVDEEMALNRLLYDLSNDEVSMVIDLFGVGCDIGPNIQLDSNLQIETKLVTESPKSEQISIRVPRTAIRHKKSQRHTMVKSTAGSTGGNKGHHEPLPRSLFHYKHPPVKHLGFNASNMVACGEHNSCGAYCDPRFGVTMPTIPSLLDQQGVKKNIVSHHPVFALPMQLLGVPLSPILAKEQQMAKKRSKMEPILPKPPASTSLQALQQKKTSKASNYPLNKRQRAPRNILGKKCCTTSVASSPGTATGASNAIKKTKVTPARRKKTKAKTTYKPEKVASRLNTCIKLPMNLNSKVWDQRLKEAKEFVIEHGHCRIPTTYRPHQELANWARRQRHHYKKLKKHILDRPDNPAVVPTDLQRKPLPKGLVDNNMPGVRIIKCHMTPQRLEKLEAIGFCMDLQARSWERMYERLCDYSKRSKGKTHPSKYLDYELWKWVGTQRYQMKLRIKRAKEGNINYSMPCLTLERINKLNEINFDWGCSKKAIGKL